MIDAVFVAATDTEHAGGDDLGHAVANARGIAAIVHSPGQARDDADLHFGQPQHQQTRVGGLIAAVEIDCEFLASNRWQIEGKRRSVGHGRGVPLRRRHARLATVCYVISTIYATANAEFLMPDA